jgi:hypothetical protein
MIALRLCHCAYLAAVVCAVGLSADGRSAAAAPPDGGCEPSTQRQRVAVALVVPESQAVISAVLVLKYDPALLRLPENGGGKAVRARLTARANGAMLTPNSDGNALRIVAARAGGLPSGPLADVEFDRCAGAHAPAVADVRCEVASCAGAGGAIDGCACAVTLR